MLDELFKLDLPFRFDLQLFAAEDEGRTEEPTEYKKRKAREEGKVAKTQELPSALILLFGFFVIFLLSKVMYRNLMGMMRLYLGSVQQVVDSGENMVFLMRPILPIIAKTIGPIVGVVTPSNVHFYSFHCLTPPVKD